MDANYLLTRGEDLAVFGVRLHGFDISEGIATASAADACIVLVLPPQHVQEQAMAAVLRRGSQVAGELSGPSRMAYAVTPGTTVTLTAEGVLAACVELRPGGMGELDTSIELPSRLAFAPRAASTDPASTALLSPAQVVGTWLMRVHPIGGDVLELVPLNRDLAGTPDRVPDPSLTADQRLKIADFGAGAPVLASRLELSTRGGNLTAGGEWDGLSWSHRVTGGRDQFVRTAERVVLYPFGFHAVLTTLTERDPEVSALVPGEPAVLRRTVTLRLTDTVKCTSDGAAMSRTFPFSRVEVTRAIFPGLGTPEPSYTYVRVTPDTQTLIDEAADLRADQDIQYSKWRDYVEGHNRTLDDLERRGDPNVAGYRAANENVEAAAAALAQAQSELPSGGDPTERLKAKQRQIEELQGEFKGPDGVNPHEEQIAELEAQCTELEAQAEQYAAAHAAVQQAEAAKKNADSALHPLAAAIATAEAEPRDIHDAVNLGGENADVSEAATKWLDDKARIADLDRQVREITALQHRETVTAWPTAPGGADRLQFPVRLSRGEQVIDVTMPMLLIYDYSLPAAPEYDLPAYRSLEDPALATELDRAWAGPATTFADTRPASVLDAGGALLDVVGAAVPKPSDTHVVRTLNLLGGIDGDLFAPTLGRLPVDGRPGRWSMGIDLPELKTLAGGAAGAAVSSSAVVTFAKQFVDDGEAAKVLFTTGAAVGDAIEVDFSQAADRSGGLAALQLAADAISRDDGPAQLAALLDPHPDPAALIGDAATLLGFKLQDLIRLVWRDVKPPTIVSELVDGRVPTVKLEWSGIPLGDLAAFRAGPDAQLDLTVVAQADGVVTDCTVTDFALQFPFDDSVALVRLDFAEVGFHQQTTYGVGIAGGVAHPPKLDVALTQVSFLHELELLKSLQDAINLGGNVPSIKPSPHGVTASFAVPVPAVSCGAFALSNLAFHSEVEVPFDARPVTVAIGFASRDKPFSLSVLSFAGGGYVDIRIDAHGPSVEASLEFGAQLSVDFVVAKGEVHALGGVQYVQQGGRVALTGYLRIGGSLEILSVITVSVELRIALAYDSAPKPRLVGRATLVLEIDLTLWSDKVEIDSGEWVLEGGGAAVGAQVESAGEPPDELLEDVDLAFDAIDAPVTGDELEAWTTYRDSFTGGSR